MFLTLFKKGNMGKQGTSRFFGHLLTFFDILTIAILAYEITAITTNVILRYVFRRSLGWIDEFASFGLLWITFASVLRLIDQDEHFHVDVIVNRFGSGRIRRGLSIFKYMLTSSFFAIVAYYAAKLCLSVASSTAFTLPVPKIWIYSILPISCFVALLILFKKILNQKG